MTICAHRTKIFPYMFPAKSQRNDVIYVKTRSQQISASIATPRLLKCDLIPFVRGQTNSVGRKMTMGTAKTCLPIPALGPSNLLIANRNLRHMRYACKVLSNNTTILILLFRWLCLPITALVCHQVAHHIAGQLRHSRRKPRADRTRRV